MKTEGELLQLLPEGPARKALLEKVEVDVLQHMDLEKDRRYSQWFRAAVCIVLFQAVAAGALAYAGIAGAIDGSMSGWVGWVIAASLVSLLIAQGLDVWVKRVLRSISTESQEQAEEQVAAAGTARLDLSAGSSGGTDVGRASLDLRA